MKSIEGRAKTTFELIPVLEKMNQFLNDYDMTIDFSSEICFDHNSRNQARVRLTLSQARDYSTITEAVEEDRQYFMNTGTNA